jgi:uncharacterized sulfatase
MDERIDMIRAVCDKRYRFIRNFRPDKPYAQFVSYGEQSPIMQALRKAKADGTLPEAAKQFMAEVKPFEELYDSQNDPFEIHNLIDDPLLEPVLTRLRAALSDWMETNLDLGFVPESILADAERNLGSRYALYRGKGGLTAWKRLAQMAALTQPAHLINTTRFVDGLRNPDPAVRYWAAIGLGNLDDVRPALNPIAAALEDPSDSVRVAAARSLYKLGQTDRAIAVYVAVLNGNQQWARHEAILALDELGLAARPVLDAIKAVENDTGNPYVARVAKHAIKILEGKESELQVDP